MKSRWVVSVLFMFLFAIQTSLELHGQNKSSGVKWYYDFEEGVRQAQKEGKMIFVDVYTNWCGWCKRMDAATFQHPDIARYMNENYISIKFNAESKKPITFKGKEYKFIPQGARGYHELAAALLNGRLSYPTVVFMDENANLLTAVPGFRGPKDFEPIMVFFGDRVYKQTQDINGYIKNYQPRIIKN